MMVSATNPKMYCRECQHPLGAHHQVNGRGDCTDFYIDPATSEITFCTCSRGDYSRCSRNYSMRGQSDDG